MGKGPTGGMGSEVEGAEGGTVAYGAGVVPRASTSVPFLVLRGVPVLPYLLASPQKIPFSSPSCKTWPSAQLSDVANRAPAHLIPALLLPPPQEIDALFHDAKYSARLLAEQADKYIS